MSLSTTPTETQLVVKLFTAVSTIYKVWMTLTVKWRVAYSSVSSGFAALLTTFATLHMSELIVLCSF